MIKKRIILLMACLVLLPCLMLAEGFPRSRFAGHVPPPDVPEGERVPEAYFDDAVFIGDSIMAGLELHGLFPGSFYAAAIGIGPQNAMGKVYDTNTGKKNLEELLETVDFTKMYVLLGANAIDKTDGGAAVKRYAAFLTRFVDAYPDKLIYVISVPPRTRNPMEDKRPPLLERIDGFNQSIRELCASHGIYYLDIFSPMMQEDGRINQEYLGADGMHLTRRGSNLILEHLMSHTVREAP